jgi:NADPH:quinone reductase-like Zn-dependent oxidoreductase
VALDLIDRLGRDRTPSIPGHELAGVVTSLSYGATGLSVGQRVFGLTDWTRDGTLAEYTVVEARNLAPLPGDLDFTVGAGVAIYAACWSRPPWSTRTPPSKSADFLEECASCLMSGSESGGG